MALPLPFGGPLPFWGIDGCKSQWFGFGLSADGSACAHYHAPTIAAMWAHITPHSPRLILTDMAIGLSNLAKERACDGLARQMLGARRASVFPIICRQAMDMYHKAAAPQTTADKKRLLDKVAACHTHVTGKGVSAQAKNIIPAMAQLDGFLARHPQAPFREMHPEVAFAGLRGGQGLRHYKKTQAGIQERLNLLCTYLPQLRHCAKAISKEFPKRLVEQNDVLDAMVGALTGYLSQTHKLQRLYKPQPEQPVMEMVFVQPGGTA